MCQDLWDKNSTIQINILKDNKISKRIIDYLKEESIELSSFKADAILKNNSFGVVFDIDGVPTSEKDLFYSKEYLTNAISISEHINELSLTEIMNIFVDLASAIYYLHLKGYCYTYLNLDNIYFTYEKGTIKPKLKDYFTLIIESNLLGNNSELVKPSKLTPVVYKKSHGNPFFIMEIMQGLYEKQLIYIRDNTGVWYIRVGEDLRYDNLDIPESIEQVFLYRLGNLDDNEKSILDLMSLFSNPINLKEYGKVFKINLEELENYLNQLVEKGILSKMYSDYGILYDFLNKILKDLIYNRLSIDFRVQHHKIIADYLERELKELKEEYLDELLHHLYQSDCKERLNKYAIINGRNKLKIKDDKTAISQLEKSLFYMKYNSDDDLCEITIEIARRYYKIENIKKLEEYLGKAEDLNVKDIDKIINIYLMRADYKRFTLESNTVKEQVDKVSVLIDRATDFETKLKYKFFSSFGKIMDKDYDASIKMLSEVIEEAGDKYIQIKGEAYRYLGRAYSRKYKLEGDRSLLDRAVQSLHESIQLFEITEDTKGLSYSLFLLGNIVYTYYRDFDSAFEYHYRAYELGKKYNYLSNEIMGLNNLGNNMLERYDFRMYRKYSMEALDRSLEMNFKTRIPLMYYHLTYASYYLSDYRSLETFYKLSLQNPFYREDGYKNTIFLNVLRLSAYGDYQGAYNSILKLIEISSAGYPELENYKILRKYFIELKLGLIDENTDYFDDILQGTLSFTDTQYKILNIYKTVVELYKRGRIRNSHKLFNAMADTFDESFPHEIKARYYYTKAVISHGEEKVGLLDLAEKSAKANSIKLLLIKIAIERGHGHFNKNNYIALSYYMDALDKINSLVSTIPQEYILSFINNFDYENIFRNMSEIKMRLFKNDDKIEVDFIKEKSLNKLKYLLVSNSINIIQNESFKKEIKNIYSQYYNDNIYAEGTIAKELKSDFKDNLGLVLKYFANIVLANNGAIVIEEDGEYMPIATLQEEFVVSKYISILDRAKDAKKPIGILNSMDIEADFPLTYISIPILDDISSTKILAYIYLETDSIVNYLNEKSIGKIQEMKGLLSIFLENYKLKKLSTLDKLTGTLTRRALEDKINESILLSNKMNEDFSIIMLDLDRFKSINDRFGHLTGDIVLKEVSRIVLDTLGDKYFLGRYGGEEFIIILPRVDKKESFFL